MPNRGYGPRPGPDQPPIGPGPAATVRTMVGADRANVLLVASSGGHLAHLLALEPWWRDHERIWVTFDKPDARSQLRDEDSVVWAHHPTTRNLLNLARNTVLAVRLVRRSRPDVVISAGAGVAVPFFVMARLLRIPTVYVEVIDRIDSRTLTGRLCRPLSTRFLVQWPEQARLNRGAIDIGPLF